MRLTKSLFVFGLGLLLCGCASRYVVKLTNGGEFTTTSKPKLKNSAYYFKDAHGNQQSIPAGRVTEIEPASMAQEEAEQNQFKPPTTTKKRHWYWPF